MIATRPGNGKRSKHQLGRIRTLDGHIDLPAHIILLGNSFGPDSPWPTPMSAISSNFSTHDCTEPRSLEVSRLSISIPTISISGASLATVAVSWIYQHRKYARSTIHKLGLETFSTYLWRGMGYRFASYLRPRMAAQLSLRKFALNRLEASSSKITVPAPVPVDLNLDDMFVPLTALSSQKERVSAEQIAFGPYRNTMLVGGPGSGKSTIVQKVYRDLCRIGIARPHVAQIPVLIELKDLDSLRRTVHSAIPDQEANLFTLVKYEIISVKTYAQERLFDWFLDAGRITVMLDGLDEVKADAFEEVTADIVALRDQLLRTNPKNRLVVTTRRQLYVSLPEHFTSHFDTHLTLEPFTANDTYEFLRKWFYRPRPAAQVVDHEPERATQGQIATPADHVSSIFERFADQPNIRSMCATPLVLAMYVAMDELTKGQNIPETRPEFYKSVTDELLVRRRSRQFGLTTGLGILRRNRQRVLGRIALEHLLDETQFRNSVRWQSAVDIVAEEEQLSLPEAEARLRELSRDTGLFTEERREETLRFIHLTFCEFLAAQAIAAGTTKKWAEVSRRIGKAGSGMDQQKWVGRLAEVVVFAAALETNEAVRRRRIRWIVGSGYLDVALRAVIDGQYYDDEAVLVEMQGIANSIASTPEGDRDDQWLYLFRQMATTMRDRERVIAEIGEGSIASAALESLGSFTMKVIGDVSVGFEPLFLAYVRIDVSGALQLARSLGIDTVRQYPAVMVGALDEPDVLAHALAEFGRGDASSAEWASLLAVASIRYGSVRARLAAITYEKDMRLRLLAQDAKRAHGWSECWPIRGTLLGLILETGCRSPDSWSVLRLLADLPVRRNRALERIMDVNILGWVFIAALTYQIVVQTYSLAVGFNGNTAWVNRLLLGMTIVYMTLIAIAITRSRGGTVEALGMPNRATSRGAYIFLSTFFVDSSYRRELSSDAMDQLLAVNSERLRTFRSLGVSNRDKRQFASLALRVAGIVGLSFNSKLYLFALLKERLASYGVSGEESVRESQNAAGGRESGDIAHLHNG